MPDKLTTTQQPWFLGKLEVVADVPNKTYPPGVATVTDRVPLLPGVREECGCCQNPDDPCECKLCFNTDYCTPCHGLRWVPTKDAWKWLDSLFSAGLHHETIQKDVKEGRVVWWLARFWFEPTPGGYQTFYGEGDIRQAFFAALDAALRPLAINVEEAEAWVRENI